MDGLLELARRIADEAEVYESESVSESVDLRDDRLREIDAKRLSGVSLRILSGGRLGFSFGRPPADPGTVVESARRTLAAGPEVSFSFPLSTGLPELAAPGPEEPTPAASVVEELRRGSAILRDRTDAEVVLTHEARRTRVRIRNTSGTDVSATTTSSETVVSLQFPGGAAGVRRAVARRRFAPLDGALLDELVALYRAGRRDARPESGRMRVLFLPRSLGALTWRLQVGTSGKSLRQGVSPLAGRVGEAVLSERLTLVDAPRDPRFPDARPFDDEGVPCDRFPVFERGVFRGFHHDLEHAGRLGADPTGHGWRTSLIGADPIQSRPTPALPHLTMEPGSDSLAGLLARMGRGFVLDGVLGAHSGSLPNGDYSVGASPGYLVEGGEIVGRVKDVMVSGNVYETLREVIAVGDRPEFWSGILPPVLCDGVRVTAG